MTALWRIILRAWHQHNIRLLEHAIAECEREALAIPKRMRAFRVYRSEHMAELAVLDRGRKAPQYSLGGLPEPKTKGRL